MLFGTEWLNWMRTEELTCMKQHISKIEIGVDFSQEIIWLFWNRLFDKSGLQQVSEEVDHGNKSLEIEVTDC